MTLLGLLWHLAGFVAPAVVVGVLLSLIMRKPRTGRARWPWRREVALLMAAGVLVLLAGLFYFGRDGKMFTYAALVLVQGSAAWWLRRQ